jgi:glyoxylase-like metal-dependent hydrolase (beta-lactamase superfamily II)
MMTDPLASRAPSQHEVFAIRFATVDRQAQDNFLSRDGHDGVMPLDFFIWLVRGPHGDILVDTGFSEASSIARNRKFIVHPVEAIRAMGLVPADVKHVVLTHLHYDHAGNTDAFMNARIHIQEREMHYATGRHMCHHGLNHFFAVDDVKTMVDHTFAGRTEFHDGDATVVPGVTLHRIGGHTDGLQIVRVLTARGWVVLASDAAHYYDNLHEHNPFPAIFNLGDMLEGYRRLESLADSPDHIIPGHDPQVLERYPDAGIADVQVVALHCSPSQ